MNMKIDNIKSLKKKSLQKNGQSLNMDLSFIGVIGCPKFWDMQNINLNITR